MRRPLLALALAFVTVLGLAGTASALPADKHLELEADDGDGCASEAKNDCYRVVNGTLDGFEQGMQVHVKLLNVGSAPHNVYVTESANADDNNIDTSGDDAINGSDTIGEGEQANLTFQVPEDAEGLYFWCEVDGHETLGMWLETSVEEASGTSDGDESTDEGNQTGNGTSTDDDEAGDDEESLVPAPGPVLAFAAALAAALLLRRRR